MIAAALGAPCFAAPSRFGPSSTTQVRPRPLEERLAANHGTLHITPRIPKDHAGSILPFAEVFPNNAQVAPELFVVDAIQSAPSTPRSVILFIEGLEILQPRTEPPRLRGELRMEASGCAARPRTDLLANVATRDHHADTIPELCRNC
jgi:hypothetical protein